MTESVQVTDESLPKATIHSKRLSISFAWIVPVVAAIVAAYLIGSRLVDLGPAITLEFKDVSGLRTGHTPVRHRGVPIGDVTAIDLSKKGETAIVTIRLRRSATSIAQQGSLFWIVRPEVGIGNISGMGTVMSGPVIEVLPGAGKPQTEFVGLPGSPVILDRDGLALTLVASRVGSLRPNMPIRYRGVEVGAVLDCQLSTNATTAEIRVFIRKRFASLVREGTKFWNASGADINLALFGGLNINVESMGSLLSGGISFATPDGPTSTLLPGAVIFELHDKPDDEWLTWSPAIAIPNE